METFFRPVRVQENITVQECGDETLIYDEIRCKAFCLNKVSSRVWALADGNHTPVQIAEVVSAEIGHPVDEELVLFALGQLQHDHLLQSSEDSVIAIQVVSRRQMIRKIGVGAALMVPVVTAVFAPPAAHASSGGGWGGGWGNGGGGGGGWGNGGSGGGGGWGNGGGNGGGGGWGNGGGSGGGGGWGGGGGHSW